MRPAVEERLLKLNREFYQAFAADFSATRERLQPGVRRVIERLPRAASILDLGCGNGALARGLAARGFTGRYLGLDISPAILEIARTGMPATSSLGARFLPADLASPDWSAAIPDTFDVTVAFAVLHHLPGEARRLAFLCQVRSRLSATGQFILSHWQFLRSSRFTGRIVPWETIGLRPEDGDPGDYLLDWRRGGRGIRYVHHFGDGELATLAGRAGFRVVESFESDGREGRLSEYVVMAF